jgi:hypothetical protein
MHWWRGASVGRAGELISLPGAGQPLMDGCRMRSLHLVDGKGDGPLRFVASSFGVAGFCTTVTVLIWRVRRLGTDGTQVSNSGSWSAPSTSDS